MRFGHVSIEVSALGGGLVAVVALEAWQPRVDAPVPRHAAAPWELLTTNVTLVRLQYTSVSLDPKPLYNYK